MKTQIARGAEAILYKDGNRISKDRVSKSYRIPEIDLKLRKERTRSEAKIIRALERVGVNVPAVLKEDNTQMILELEFLDGEKLRDYLEEKNAGKKNFAAPRQTKSGSGEFSACRLAGEQAAKMHAANIAHGDLTTSNMILKENKLFLIDFGLSEFSNRVEDKAVDLHLFKECLVSKHNSVWENCWKCFLEGYKSIDKKQFNEVSKRLIIVESRGRYKQAQVV